MMWLSWLLACGAGNGTQAVAVPAPQVAPEEAPQLVAVIPGPDLIGVCDASGAAAVGSKVLIVDDEHNVVRSYDLATGGPPIDTVVLGELSPLLAGEEADLEGMAVAADGTVWVIASHDSGKGNERQPQRQRLFGLKVTEAAGALTITLAHGPTTELIEKGQQKNALYGIVVNTVGKTSKESSGLSIEGLAAGPADSLLIGFRTPIHDGMALVERLDNPVAFAGGAEPVFTGPRWLDLGKRGIRSLEADGTGFLVLAGDPNDGGTFALFRWAGFEDGSAPVALPVSFGDLNPEALVKHGDQWWVVSDDGRRKIGGEKCKDLPQAQRRARTARVP